MVPGAPVYEFQLSQDSTFQQISVQIAGGSNTYDTLIHDNSRWYWRVRVELSGNSSNWSSTSRFQVLNMHKFQSLSLWLRTDTGITTDLNGGLENWYGSGLDGQSIAQSTPSFRPLLGLDSLSGWPVLSFDGTDDYLEGTMPLDFSGGFTVFILGRNHVRKNWNYLFEIASSLLGNRFLELYWARGTTDAASGSLVLGANSAAGGSPPLFNPFQDVPPSINSYYLVSIALNAQGSDILVNEDSLADFANAPGLIPDQPSRIFVGTWGTADTYLDGDIAEMIFFNDKLQREDQRIVSGYLKSKFSPAVNLGEDIYVPYGFCDTSIRATGDFQSFEWSTGANFSQITVSENGLYSVTATDIFGNISTDRIRVIYPGIPLPAEQFLCFGDSANLSTGLSSSYSYSWNTGESTSQISASAEGSFWVVVTDTNNCTFNSDTLDLQIDSSSIQFDLGSDTAFCSGNVIAIASGGSLVDSIRWSDGSSASTLTIQTSGTYFVNGISLGGCRVTDTIEVLITGQAPTADFLWNDFCMPDTVLFVNLSTASGIDSIAETYWLFGDGDSSTESNPAHPFSAPGNYQVALRLTSIGGCAAFKTKNLSVLPPANPTFSIQQPAFQGDSLSFIGQAEIPDSNLNSFTWFFGDGTQGLGRELRHAYQIPGVYQITLISRDINGCLDSANAELTVSPIPNNQHGVLWLRADRGVQIDGNTRVQQVANQFDTSSISQTDGAFRPSLSANTLNGFPVLNFDGLNDYLVSDNPLDLSDGMSIFMVARNRIRKRFNYLFSVSITPFKLPNLKLIKVRFQQSSYAKQGIVTQTKQG